MRRLLLLILAFLTVIEVCNGDILIDPNSGGSGFNLNIKFFAPTGQSFTADGANLISIGMWADTCNCPNDPPVQFQLTLLNGSGTSGTLVATRTATATIGLSGFLDFDFTGTTLTIGQTYTAVMTQISPTPPDQAGTDIAGTSNVYSGGIAFISAQAHPDLDFFLRVRSATSSGSAPPVVTGTGVTGTNLAPRLSVVEPIDTGSGNYLYQHSDFAIPSRGFPLIFQRTYNSLDSYSGPLGANWSHTYNILLGETPTGDVVIRWADAHGETFTLNGTTYTPQPGLFSTLIKNADGTFTLTQKNQSRYQFSSLGKRQTTLAG